MKSIAKKQERNTYVQWRVDIEFRHTDGRVYTESFEGPAQDFIHAIGMVMHPNVVDVIKVNAEQI